MVLYERDYKKGLTEEENAQYKTLLEKEKEGMIIGRKNMYPDYPIAVHRYESLFPNNHVLLSDLKKEFDLQKQNLAFLDILNNSNSKERDILNFINHEHAYHIIASIFSCAGLLVGHHNSNYLFPEFSLENGRFRADYLLIGKGSGGHEFVFVELEAPNGRTTLKSGDYGEATRKGNIQACDWQSSIEGEFTYFIRELNKAKGNQNLPDEFLKYDSTRFHYVIVTGRRIDYKERTYLLRRKQEGGRINLHYDNLYDAAETLLEANTF